MSIETEKTAAPVAPALSREQLLQQYYGNQLLHSIGAGAGVGVGATALYHLLRELKKPGKKEKKYNDPAAYGSGSPMIAKEGADLSQTLGSLLPKHLLPFEAPGVSGGLPSADPYAWRKAWSTAANIGGAAAGAYGGHRLIQAIAKAKKKRELAEAVEDARRSYYDALGGYDKAAALDAAYDHMKQGNALLGAGIGAGLGGLAGLLRSEKGERLQGLLSGVGAGGLAGAGIGALAPHAAPYVQPYVGKLNDAVHKMTAPAAAKTPSRSRPFPSPIPRSAQTGRVPAAPPAPTAPAPRPTAAAPNRAPTFLEQLGAAHAQGDRSLDPPASIPFPRRAPRPSGPAATSPFMSAKIAGVLGSIYNTPQALRTAYLLSILGAGGLGAHYMYNRTKELTEGENLAKAQASRARLKGLPPVWVDPDSLAQVKQLAENDE